MLNSKITNLISKSIKKPVPINIKLRRSVLMSTLNFKISDDKNAPNNKIESNNII